MDLKDALFQAIERYVLEKHEGHHCAAGNWFLIICATALPWAYAGDGRGFWWTNFSRLILPDNHRGYSCAGCILPSSMRPTVF